MKKVGCAILAIVLTVALQLGAIVPVDAQIPELPPPPAEAQPLVNVVSPLSFQACLAPSILIGLGQTANTVAPIGLPVPVTTVTDPVVNLLLLDLMCAYFSPKIVPPTCELDQTVYGNIPATVVNMPQPASILATEILAVQQALNAYGAPIGDQLSSPVNGQLGCRQ
jgi:hypothetical protein